MSTLIVGEDSLIGAAYYHALHESDMPVHGTSRRGRQGALTLDLAADPKDWPQLPHCEVAFICAGITKLDACERDAEAARRVNIEGTTALAKKLNDGGSFVVFLSSNHVFDGTKPHRSAADAPCPINEYGRQKAETESNILALGKSAALRLTKVIARGDARIGAWANELRSDKPVSAFDDVFLAPSTLDNVLEAMQAIAAKRKPGIYQLSGANDFSYFDLAQAIAAHMGKDISLVRTGSGGKAGIPASFRPRYSSYAAEFPAIKVPTIDGLVDYALT